MNDCTNYSRSLKYLARIKKGGAWLSMLQQLQESSPDILKMHYQTAIEQIKISSAFAPWYFFKHQTEKVVEDLLNKGELSKPRLDDLTVWLLTIEWVEQHADDMNPAKKSNAVRLPKILQTAEAKEIWARLREAGFIVEGGYGLVDDVSANQATYIADCMAVRLGIKYKWKVFQGLWNIKNMAQMAGSWKYTGKLPPRAKEIEDLI